MRKKRIIHSPQFKAKAARQAIEDRETVSEIAEKYGTHLSQLSDWKREVVGRISELFQRKSKKVEVDPVQDVESLQKKVGQLSLEIDFLEPGLALVAKPKKGNDDNGTWSSG